MSAFLRLVSAPIIGCVLVSIPPLVANAALEDTVSEVAEHMHEHLDQISAMKSAVVAGRLEDIREPANWLATHEEPVSLPPVEEMRSYAARAAVAEDLVAAASYVGEIARTCGDCHVASGVKVRLGFSEPPDPDAKSLTSQMQFHLWAADRMWAGLIAPSNDAWKQGADMLADIELAASDVTAEGETQVQVRGLIQRSRALGEQARQATSAELRSGLYGEYLSLCATCHTVTGGGPAPR